MFGPAGVPGLAFIHVATTCRQSFLDRFQLGHGVGTVLCINCSIELNLATISRKQTTPGLLQQ